MAGPFGLSGDRRRGDRRLRRADDRIDDGHGYIAVDEIRMSNQPTPAATRPGGASCPGDRDRPGRGDRGLASRLTQRWPTAWQPPSTRRGRSRRRSPTRLLALAIADGTGDERIVHIRGNHKNLGEVVPRRFLEVSGGSASATPDSRQRPARAGAANGRPGRNPLMPRVLVNRLWKHHFGEGIVKSTDDFGAMGQKPSHPGAARLAGRRVGRRGWSIKAMHRLMVTSSTYRMASRPVDDAERLDPANMLSAPDERAGGSRPRRSATRSWPSPAGWNEMMYGPSVPVHLTSFMEGRGRPGQSGPLDGDGRRSFYLNVRRNFLNPMFLAFDTPVPFSTMGRRNVSNVPAQALTLMNDPLVVRQARLWAERRWRLAPGRTAIGSTGCS